jgi:hypothetical protein
MRLLPFLILVAVSCSESAATVTPDPDGSVQQSACTTLDASVAVDAACAITVATPPCVASPHVAVGTDVQYNSNPPSSGPHFPIWADFKVYDKPVPRGYWVHSMEHGAVVLAYRCDGDAGGCPDIVAALKSVADALPRDPLCSAETRVRVVITPDPLLDVPIAAAAWGWTYKAACLDVPSLIAFAKDRYAKGPENTCANGQGTF